MSIEPAGIALNLVIVATNLAIKVREFRKRMRGRRALLDGFARYCDKVRVDANMIRAQVDDIDGVQTLGEQDPLRVLAVTLGEIHDLLVDFDKELGELRGMEATTMLGRAIVQLNTDDLIPRIEQIQREIDQEYRSLSVCIPFALHRRSSTVSIPAPPPSPPLTPDYERPPIPSRNASFASTTTLFSTTMTNIETATKRLDLDTVKRLLDDDTTGELVKFVDNSGRTLIDIAIYHGRSTHRSQVPLVKMLKERGVKFTLKKDQRLKKTYQEVARTIKLQARMRM